MQSEYKNKKKNQIEYSAEELKELGIYLQKNNHDLDENSEK